VCELRGEPSFRGGSADSGYPPWLRADQATCWSDAAGTVYLGLREGPDSITMIGGGKVSGKAIVDLDIVRQKSGSGSWFDPTSYLTGTLPVCAVGDHLGGVARCSPA